MVPAASIDSTNTCALPDFRIEEMLHPIVFPHPVTQLELRGTHISWVILTGSFAYKIKKRVKLDFVDTTSLARRRFLCEEELRLNRRLASGLYQDVVPITQDDGGMHIGGSGPIVEYAVRMRQFDASQELPALLARSEVSLGELTSLAEQLVDFHSHASAVPAGYTFDYVDRLRNSVLGNFAILLSHLNSTQPLPGTGLLIDWTHDCLRNFAPRFRQRQERGFVRECHGDLHAHNIVRWNGQLTPFDCLEFDPELRWIDVMNDIAFLVMDLVAHGRGDLAYGFLSRYVERTGDYEGIRLLPFYAVYRALVRAMVDALSAEQRPAQYLELHERLQGRIRTAVEFMQPKAPTLFIMYGPSGSGKSWLSEHLVPLIAGIRVRSDLERKRLAGIEPSRHNSARETLYTPAFNQRTYRRLAECAESCLLAGVNTIVDAAFLSAEERRNFQDLAQRLNVRFVIVSCLANETEMTRRIARRRRAQTDSSDADSAVLDLQLHNLEPLGVHERPHVISIDTTLPSAQHTFCAALRARDELPGIN